MYLRKLLIFDVSETRKFRLNKSTIPPSHNFRTTPECDMYKDDKSDCSTYDPIYIFI